MMEIAAATMGSQRSSLGAAAGSAGISTPASYMRQAMDRNSRPSTSSPSATTGGTIYIHTRSAESSSGRTSDVRQERQAGRASSAPGGTVYPGERRSSPAAAPPGSGRGGTQTTTDTPPAAGPPQAGRPPQAGPSNDPTPPPDGGRA
jgi:hypothetical protein